jgi:hypothetical protein
MNWSSFQRPMTLIAAAFTLMSIIGLTGAVAQQRPDNRSITAAPAAPQPYICDSNTDVCTCIGSANCDKLKADGVCHGGTLKPGTGSSQHCDWQHSQKPGGSVAGATRLKSATNTSRYQCNGITNKCTCSGGDDCDSLKASNDCLDDVVNNSCNWKKH